jgi:hypothetical protein
VASKKSKKSAKKSPAEAKRRSPASKAERKDALLQASKEALAAAKRGAKPETVGALVVGRILEGKMPTAEIAKDVSKRCKSDTTPAVVYWYRGHLKGLGVKLPERAQAA